MIRKNNKKCPYCNTTLKYYDTVMRMLKEGDGKCKRLYIRRFKCYRCNNIHRELPDNVYPYKHYDAEIIDGVLKGYITSGTLGYEDYPCELTMIRWRQKICIDI